MFKLVIIIVVFMISSAVNAQTIYNYNIVSIEGNNKPIAAYQGKKILLLTLPIQQNSSSDSLLVSLDSLRAAYSSSLVIIAVPSYEDGYTQAKKNELKQWYRSKLGLGIIITTGLHTRKTSGTQQHPLFKWLTDKNKNENFDQDITGPGNKFIVWLNGELTAVLGVQSKLGGSTINSLLQGQ